MLKQVIIICVMVFSMLMLISTSWALDFVPGKYEITAKVEMPGMPTAAPAQTTTQCMTEQDPVPSATAASQDCSVLKMETKKNTVSWEMECSQQGQKMKSSGQITYSGKTFEGTTQMNLGPQAGNMTITTVISGKRVGDCK